MKLSLCLMFKHLADDKVSQHIFFSTSFLPFWDIISNKRGLGTRRQFSSIFAIIYQTKFRNLILQNKYAAFISFGRIPEQGKTNLANLTSPPNWEKVSKTGQFYQAKNSAILSKTDHNSLKLFVTQHTLANRTKLRKAEQNWAKLRKIEKNWEKLNKLSKIEQSWVKLCKTEQLWAKLKPYWAKQRNTFQHWTKLIKFD